MKFPFLLLFLCPLLMAGCNANKDTAPHFIKVFIYGNADSVTEYNKGVGMLCYGYIDLRIDSIVYRIPNGSDTVTEYVTYSGYIYDIGLNDTIRKVTKAFRKYKEGLIKETLPPEGSVYCGLEYNVEYTYGNKVKRFTFLQSESVTAIDRFTTLFNQLLQRSWNLRAENRVRLNIDSLTVASLKGFGYYDSIPKTRVELPNGAMYCPF